LESPEEIKSEGATHAFALISAVLFCILLQNGIADPGLKQPESSRLRARRCDLNATHWLNAGDESAHVLFTPQIEDPFPEVFPLFHGVPVEDGF
jgi:hypothetical protein